MSNQIRMTPVRSAVILAIAGVTTAGTASAQIEEIIVTATKRSETAQDIPVTIQALGAQAMDELNITNFEDYIRHLPGVTSGGRGPGRQNVFIRGVSTGKGGVKIAGAVGTEPTVAFYLDEAPISIGGRSLDPYLTDMNRVEVLPGPQGTLFGASSQAGTVRLITNKPEFNESYGGFNASVSSTSSGELSNSVDAYLNIPLIDDTLAARVALYSVKEGGFIDNIPGSKQIGLGNPALSAPPLTRETVFNNALAEEDFNDATYQGVRPSIKYAPNDNWEFLLQHMHQELETEGVWDYDPLLGDLNSQTFSPDRSEDVWDHTAWTVNARLAELDFVYTGSFLDRELNATQDYSGYADVGPFIPYYICDYPGYANCGAPDLFVNQFFAVERTNHELRVSTDQDRRWRVIAGIFNDDTETVERGDWVYPATIDQGFAPNAPFATATSSNPNTRAPGVAFFNDFTRGKKETSFFGEFSFDLTDQFTATIGARRYDIELDFAGSSNFATRGTDGDSGRNVNEVLAGRTPADFQDTILKGNLQWQANDDIMLYVTWSEGYRPGGFNRNGGASLVPGVGPFVPDFYVTDELTNTEFGWKTSLLGDTLRFNGAIYSLDWTDMQVGILDFAFSNLTFIDNSADAEISGLETDITWAPTDEFTLYTNISFNDTELTRTPPGTVTVSPVGAPLALAPELQYAIRARYDWTTAGDYDTFAQVGTQFTDDTTSAIVLDAQFPQSSYSTVDAAFGVTRDNWSATLFFENLTDERADVFISNEDDIVKISTNRPRTIGLRFSYDLGKN